jgi:hypothetical protein
MAHKYHQDRSDRMDESLGERRGKESGKSQSYKSRRDESRGMKGHKNKYDEPRRHGSSNHGDGWVSEYHRGYGPYTMDKHSKDPGYKNGRMEAMKVAQKQEDWGCGCSDSMRQYESGSMDYLSDKNEIRNADEKRISRQMLPQ